MARSAFSPLSSSLALAASLICGGLLAPACSGSIDGGGANGAAQGGNGAGGGGGMPTMPGTPGSPSTPGSVTNMPGTSSGNKPGTPSTPGTGTMTMPPPTGPAVDVPGLMPEPPPNVLDQAKAFACDPAKDKGASPARLWRITNAQLKSTLFAGSTGNSVLGSRRPLAAAPEVGRFSNQSANGGMDLPTQDALLSLALDWANNEIKRGPACGNDGASTLDAACAKSVMSPIVSRAFRRPATPEEIDRYVTRAVMAAPDLGKKDALAASLVALFMAPETLWRWELGEGMVDARGRRALGSWEMANAIALTLTDAAPDDMLKAAAMQNALSTPDQIRPHVARLLATPAGANVVDRFFDEYLLYPEAKSTFKDNDHKNEIKSAIMKERGIPAKENGKVDPLLTGAPKVDATDAWMKTVVSGKNFVSTLLAGKIGGTTEPRAGLLTEESWLFRFSEADRNDPIRRGKFITERLLCNVLPEIPLGIVNGVSDDEKTPLRQRLAVHATSPACTGCHKFLDGIGLAFENFDDFGNLRQNEYGNPLDTHAELLGSDVDGMVTDAVDLSKRLAKSERVRQCFMRQGFRYWMGRNEREADACTLRAVDQAYIKSGGDITETFTAFFTSDAFRYRVNE